MEGPANSTQFQVVGGIATILGCGARRVTVRVEVINGVEIPDFPHIRHGVLIGKDWFAVERDVAIDIEKFLRDRERERRGCLFNVGDKVVYKQTGQVHTVVSIKQYGRIRVDNEDYGMTDDQNAFVLLT